MQVHGLLSGLLLGVMLSSAAVAEEAVDDKLFYYLGTAINRSLAGLALSDQEKALVLEGFSASLNGTAEELDDNVYGPKIQQLGRERAAQAAQRELAAGQEWVAQMAKEPGARQTASGLVYREVQAGTGKQPGPASRVRAHYHGTLRDGSVFDSSRLRGEPISIGLNQVIPCWTEGIALMKAGGKAVLTCPAAIAYGNNGQGSIPPNAALTFEVELLEVLDSPQP